MLRETDFDDNAIGIDPADCGCVDCQVGNSIPESDISSIRELLQEHFTEGRKIVNRTYASILVAYKSTDGVYTYASLSLPDPSAEIRVIEPEASSYDGESIVICESSGDYEPNLGADDDPDNVKIISRDNRGGITMAIEKHFRFNRRIANRTPETFIFHESYGEYGYVALDIRRGTQVSIIR
jgi:hypothetical protein